MRCFVINLDRSEDRWRHVLAEFLRQGLMPERVAAVDAAELPPGALALPQTPAGWKRMTAAEIACFLSHRECWRRIVEGSDPLAAIFEDDIVLADGAASLFMNKTASELPGDIAKIESHGQSVLLSRKGQKFARSFQLHRLASLHHGSAGYILTKRAAGRLLALSEDRLPCQVDHFLFDPAMIVMRSMTVLQMVPALVSQGRLLPGWHANFDSTIRAQTGPLQSKAPRSLAERLLREIRRLQTQAKRVPGMLRAAPLALWQRLYYQRAIVPIHARKAPDLHRGTLDQRIGDGGECTKPEDDQQKAGSARNLGRETIR